MKNKITYIIALLAIMGINDLFAINNSIASVQGYNLPCGFDFRDTNGTRTYTPTSYYWDFGDGSTPVTTKHASHSYAYNGTYTVIHMSSDGTTIDTAILTLTVSCASNKPLKAIFSHYSQDTVDPQKVYFTDHSEGKPISYLWSFGDGTSSTQKNPVHTYSSSTPQTYTVHLKVYDGTSYDSTNQMVSVKTFDSCGTFYAYFHYQRDTNCKNMLFINASHWTATNYSWDFGDASTSTSTNPSHLYASIGLYNVTLIASNSKCADTITHPVLVSCRSCYSVTASIDLQIDSSTPGKAVLYNYSYGAINSHYWDFGDGQTSTLASPNHTYTSPGIINLMYVVKDTSNCTDTARLTFEIDSSGNIKRGLVSLSLQVIDRTNGNTSSIKNTEIEAISLYPNPTQTSINLKNTSMQDLTVSIVNFQGQVITQLSIPYNSIQKIDVHLWPSGIYLIKADNGALYKFIKQ